MGYDFSWQKLFTVLKYNHKEVTVIYVLIYFTLCFLIFNLISFVKLSKKRKNIFSSNKVYISKTKFKYLNSYIDKIESKLFNLGYPFKLNTKKYIIIKFVLPTTFLIAGVINKVSIKGIVILFLLSFFILDYLIFNFKNNEKNILVNEIRNLTNSVIITLSSYATLEQALNSAKMVLTYKRFKEEYERFIYEYKMSGYNLKESGLRLESKFYSYELSLLITTLLQGEKQGNILESMKKYSETLELNYFKYLKKKSAQRLLYVTLATIISLVNIVLIVMYPMFTQVVNNLQIMFS